MKLLNTCFFIFVLVVLAQGQTILYSDIGESHNDLGAVVIDITDPVDISNCSSIEFSVDFSFSQPWEGSGGMETADECNFGSGCAGDPDDPLSGDCPDCWDFMWIQLMVDGSTVDENLIGEAGTDDSEQFGSYSYTYCVEDGDSEANFEFQNMNWAGPETNTYSNVTIICWENPTITTNDPICGTQQLTLDGDVPGTDDPVSWEWSSDGSADIDNPNIQNTFAEDAEDGEEFTLTIEDINGCEGTEMATIAAGGFEVDVNGGGNICGCSDDDSDLLIEITDGVPLFTVTVEINGTPLILPSIDVSGLYRICSDPGFDIGIDDTTDPTEIVIPEFFFPIDIEVVSVVDDTGCDANITGGTVTYEIAEAPEINQPTPPNYCIGSDGLVDLTIMNDEIDGGEGYDIIWYEDEDLEDEISDPTAYDVNNGNIVYAVVDDGSCTSESIEIGLNFNLQPEFTLLMTEINDCGQNPYFLPPLNEVVTIVNGISPGYYLNANGMDGPVLAINPEEVSSIFIYDGSGSDCFAEVEIPITVTPTPIINSPLNELGGCGDLILPEPDLEFEVDYEYNTEMDGSGMRFTEGDVISPSSGITTLFLIVTGNGDCITIEELDIVLSNSIEYNVNIPNPTCDSLILPAITPATGGVAYFSATQGMGLQFNPGDVIYAPFMGSLFVFDPTIDPLCASEDTLVLDIGFGPQPNFPADTSACGFLVLPQLTGVTGPHIRYSTFKEPLTSSNLYGGDTIFFDQLLYIHDTIDQCIFLDSINININVPAYTGIDSTINVCQGFSSSTIDLMDLLSNPALGGQWSYPTVPDFMPNDSTMVDLSVLPIGTWTLTYGIETEDCGLQTNAVTVEVIAAPFGGDNAIIDTCVGGEGFNFMQLVGNPDSGGTWEQVNGSDDVDLTDSTNVNLAGLTPGMYAFLYIIEGDANSGFCDAESSSLFLTINPGANAGQDSTFTVCIGETVDFSTIISPTADTNGMLEGDGIVFSGNSWNTTGSTTGQIYDIQYVVNSNNIACPNDTAFFTIDLVDILTAGNPVTDLFVCEGEQIQLSNFIENASTGGTFVLASDFTTEIIDGDWEVVIGEEVAYIVAGTAGCPSDTTLLSFDITAQPQFGINPSVLSICSGDPNELIDLNVINILGGDLNFTIRLEDQSSNTTILEDTIMNIGSTVYISPNDPENVVSNDTIFIGTQSNLYNLYINAFTGDLECASDNQEIISFQVQEAYSENIDTTICPGDVFNFRGVDYDQSTVVSFPSSIVGCDSTFMLNIDFVPQVAGEFTGTFCIGDIINILGMPYSRDTAYTETFTGMSEMGCDSIVNIDINFQTVAVGTVSETLCSNQTIEVEGQIFDINNPSDEILLPSGSAMGCDSLIEVDITFISSIEFDLAETLCPGDSVIVGTDVYNASNSVGSTNLVGQANGGCDSLVNVNLTFLENSITNINGSLCMGSTVESNGVTYDENNPQGEETLINAVGCDSIVIIDLTFRAGGMSDFTASICEDEEIIIGLDTYDINNLTGSSRLVGQSANGCDSTVNVTLTITQPSSFLLEASICPGEEIIIDGDVYDQNNMSGTSTLIDQASSGCDSIVNVELTILAEAMSDVMMVICPGESVMIGSDLYDENNLTGTTILQAASINGCDSIVNVMIEVDMPLADITTSNICPNETESVAILNSVTALNLPLILTINNTTSLDVNNLPFEFNLPLGMNTVSIIDANNCMYEETVEVMTIPMELINLDSLELSLNSYQLNLSTGYNVSNIVWNPTSGLSCSDCETPIATIEGDISYTAFITTDEGCEFEQSISLEYTEPPVRPLFYFPTVIDVTNPPNDNFYVQSNDDGAIISQMIIFDRWGNKIFESVNTPVNDPTFGWDGTMNNKFVVQGVYVYSVTILASDGSTELIADDITVLR